MISQKLIAEKAGVSYATVSRALTHSAKVRPETITLIRKAMKELGIDSEEQIFTGSNALSRMVMVVVGDILKDFFTNVVVGISDKLQEEGYTVVLCNSHYDADTEISYITKATEQRYAGIIMITVTETPELVKMLQQASIPIILVNRYIRSLDLDVVRIDNYRGGYMAGQHLLDNGHRRIAHLAGPKESATTQDRLRGFADALYDRGITLDIKKDVMYGDLSRESGKTFAAYLQKNDYTAAFIGNDYMTAGTVSALTKNNIRVPDHFSIICFDDSAIVNEDSINITSISFNPQTMGASAAEALLNRIHDPLGQRIRTIYSPCLTDRKSVLNIT